MHHRHGKSIWVLLVVALFTLQAGAVKAAEFSAVIVTNSAGEERRSKIYINGDKIRREFANPGGNTIFIVPGDKAIMWMLEPEIQVYRELPFDKDASPKSLNLPKEGGESKLVGTETLNGYVTDKYETSIKTPTGTRMGTMWISKKLGVPLKIETADKLFVQEYKDIKEGGVDDALFAIPSGYRKKDMPPGIPKK
jgi:outer membrane lipoprotein-sorting protein